MTLMEEFLFKLCSGDNVARRRTLLERLVEDGHHLMNRSFEVYGSRGTNVFVRVKSGFRPKKLLLTAHYDKVPESHGALDNGAAVSQLVEVARELKKSPIRGLEVIFGFLDAEEKGLYGSMFAAEVFLKSHFEGVYNFDLTGRGDNVVVASYSKIPENIGEKIITDKSIVVHDKGLVQRVQIAAQESGMGSMRITMPPNDSVAFSLTGHKTTSVSTYTMQDVKYSQRGMSPEIYLLMNSSKDTIDKVDPKTSKKMLGVIKKIILSHS